MNNVRKHLWDSIWDHAVECTNNHVNGNLQEHVNALLYWPVLARVDVEIIWAQLREEGKA